ncbi:MAG: sigma-54-dependent Fis family transcriptional regulator [Deltaproteobacteria bacterium]|nr:sigma-54-dependent Fis family transcriptional regulator [Deltaproteobacteria bacterium]
MRKVLLAWVGRTDLRAPTEGDQVGVGPIAQALDARAFDEAYLLSDYDAKMSGPYAKWLRARTKTRIEILEEKLSGPTQFGEIHEAAVRSVDRVLGKHPHDVALSFHLSPGTPAMAAVWILLGKTRFPAELIESSKDHGVRTAAVPFDISADFIPDLLREKDERLRAGSAATPSETPEFADIIHRSKVMARLIERARRVAVRNVPVLVEGESGTGKEMLARAIHRASTRRDKPFVAVNCGAIPAHLVESELFGHEKGAFTDAKTSREGYFEAANKGTLFLDELGELPGPAQVKLLRAIQEGEIVRLGATKPVKVDVRIVAATNRTLTEEITAGRFREDLFYRLAVAVLKLPPLRDRSGDLGLLIDHSLAQVNREAAGEPGFKEKKLSAGARNLLLGHPWPGNVRELLNTLRRAAIWSEATTISTDDAREALLPAPGRATAEVLDRPLGEGFNLAELLGDVARHYLSRAMEEAHGNKTQAAALVGAASYQTLTNWLEKYKVQT